MSRKTFTPEEVVKLSQNRYVQNVTTNGITYTDEFKHIFLVENESGKLPREIFESCGFDVEVIGIKRIKSSGNRWRNAYKKDGMLGLRDTRKGNSGRPRIKDLTLEEKNDKLEAQIKLLKAENELLKNIRRAERGLRKKK